MNDLELLRLIRDCARERHNNEDNQLLRTIYASVTVVLGDAVLKVMKQNREKYESNVTPESFNKSINDWQKDIFNEKVAKKPK